MSSWMKGSASAEGREIRETGSGLRLAIDCPKCIHGTLDPSMVDGAMICIDCGEVFSRDELVALKLIHKRKKI